MAYSSYIDASSVIHFTEDGIDFFTMTEEIDEKVKTVTVSLSGKMTGSLSLDFADEIVALISVGYSIVLNMAEVKYISNSCLQMLLNIQKRIDELRKSSLTIKNITPEIFEKFESAGMSELLMIE